MVGLSWTDKKRVNVENAKMVHTWTYLGSIQYTSAVCSSKGLYSVFSSDVKVKLALFLEPSLNFLLFCL